jgi:CRISPR-associated protein Csd1
VREAENRYPTICDALRECLPRTKGGNQSDRHEAICLVYGKKANVARIHSSIKGVWNTQSSGAALVSFNADAFNSYGSEQNYNAPLSERAAFAYTTALNTLLSKSSTQRLQIGDATTVFWAEKPNFLENSFASLLGFSPKDNPDMETEAIRALYQSVHTGKLADGGSTRFYILGLSPNAGRISVRFWHQDTVEGLSRKIRNYFDDVDIQPHREKGCALMYMLSNLALEGKADNIPPNLAGSVMRAILNDAPFPVTLLHLAVRRIRAEQEVTRQRAAILKAVLNRSFRQNPANHKEITVSLDPTNHSPGYLLGRLFAALEKIQEDAQPGINATIKDRYYGAASSSPVSVFPLLLKLKNHHLAKLDNQGQKVSHEKRLTEIFDGISHIPPHLDMEAQALFAIGYYHQRQDIFTKKPQAEPTQA